MIAIARNLADKNKLPAVLSVLIIYLAAIISMTDKPEISTAVLLTALMLAALHDLYDRTIPYSLTISAMGAGIILCAVFGGNQMDSMLGCVIAFVLSKMIIFISKGQLGGGDAAMMTVSGLYSGVMDFIQILFISFLFAGFYSVLLITVKKADKKTEIPFAPFMLAGTAMLFLLKAL